ncbi:MAG: diaminopimelate epimerase, partial [Eubacterium sp.]
GLYPTPPYYAVKVPVFSFEKLNDVNSKLGPEMKSTGEVLGVGKNLVEALFKGLVSAGFKTDFHRKDKHGVLITVTKQDRYEIVNLAKKLDDLGAHIWATPETARAIESLGIEVSVVNKLREDNSIMELVESGQLDYIVYTGKSDKKSIADYIRLHNRANQLGIAVITSLDTANAVADIIASRYKQTNTELVDINNMRKEKGILKFSKMEGTGDDYIFFNNQCGIITCPESLAIEFSDRHRGIGGDGIVLIEESEIADAKMRIFNIDGSEGKMAGNVIRCVGKYLYDNNIVKKDKMTVETASGVKALSLYTRNGKVSSATVDMGRAELTPQSIPVSINADRVINYDYEIGGTKYKINCCSIGNPHCVVFVDNVDKVDINKIGPQFETADIFPERINTEFVRVVNSNTLKMRVWERGNGETQACGTGACAAVICAVENGYCTKGESITVKVKGGDLIVNYSDDGVTLTGDCSLVYTGEIEY